MKVKDAMHKGVYLAEISTPISELAKQMREHDVGAIPIHEKNKLIGMVTDRDIVVRALANGRDLSHQTAKDIMSNGIIACRENQKLEDAIKLMEERKIRRLPVLDENDNATGMLTLGDLSHSATLQMSGEVLTCVSAHHR
ncbi:MAG: CBS domain-containing protein [Hyphomicrobium sp.]